VVVLLLVVLLQLLVLAMVGGRLFPLVVVPWVL
jgi:hypothetical protein